MDENLRISSDIFDSAGNLRFVKKNLFIDLNKSLSLVEGHSALRPAENHLVAYEFIHEKISGICSQPAT